MAEETKKEKKKYYCEKCGQTMSADMFYTSNNREKYPNDGKLRQCKKCITMFVDNWDPETFKPILQEIDVPFVQWKWDKILARYIDKPDELTPMTIMGRYLSQMKLAQYRNYRWADSEWLTAAHDEKKVETMTAAGYTEEEIMEELNTSHTPPKPVALATDNLIDTSLLEDDMMDELSEEDKTYLRLKWGRGYRADEWVRMEQLYEDFMASYDIQGAGTKDTLILICKTSLKANQCIDSGDFEGYQKMSRVYDSLMKSAKFTAAQNKEGNGNAVDSIGELVAMCEKEGFIPRFYVDQPKDQVDRTLQDLQNYTHSLVTEEMNLGTLIEQSLNRIERDKANEASMDADESENDENFAEQLFSEQAETLIRDEDFIELNQMEDDWEEQDKEYMSSIKGSDD